MARGAGLGDADKPKEYGVLARLGSDLQLSGSVVEKAYSAGVQTQGSSARLTPETKELPIDAVIVGIVDTVHVDSDCVFSREN